MGSDEKVHQVSPDPLTRWLREWGAGDEKALAKLLPRVYGELHRIAERYLRHERSDHTLQATALIHETFLKLVDQRRIDWQSRTQFFGVSAQLMRRILVDHARRTGNTKRGGDLRRVRLDAAADLGLAGRPDLLALDEALDSLAAKVPELARIVELRFFGGLKSAEIAGMLNVSVPTVTRRWRTARAWLYRELCPEQAGG